MVETANDGVASSAKDEEAKPEDGAAPSATNEEAKHEDGAAPSATNEEAKPEDGAASSAKDEGAKDEDGAASSAKDEEAKDEDGAASSQKDEEAKDEEPPSITELLVQLGRDVSVLAFLETQLAASRNLPQVRRTTRDIAGAIIAALAFLTAFAFANVAALSALATAMSTWVAGLVLCAAWLVLGLVVTVALMVRAGRVTGWKWWRVFWEGPEESLEDLEQARDNAEGSVRETLTRLTPAMTVEIASASVAVAGDVAGGVVDVGEDILDASDEMVEAIAEQLPGGSVVNQVWDVVLAPGRLGVKAATTVLRRGDVPPPER